MFQENPEESGSDAGPGRWEHTLTRPDHARRIHVGAPDARYGSRLFPSAWVLPKNGCQSVSTDTRGRVTAHPGVLWHLGITDAAVVSVRAADGLVVIRSASVLDPTAGEVAAWNA